MAGLSQSQFLQALGWSTLNSFWQMAFLWCCFWVANRLFNLSASKKYALSVAAVATGFAWFVASFLLYLQNGSASNLRLLEHSLEISATTMPVYLTAASVAYLLLLFIPAYKLLSNWRFVQLLRKTGLQKVDIQYKLFVKKVSAHLGLKRNVGVYFSDLIKSPVTIGYLKPIILLPVASANHLSMQQAEAVLLHELSHIKRCDYLVNLLLSIAHTLLYFNPFVRFFIRVAEDERENCCDQMVLQFGYDKMSYATALLSLEKAAVNHRVFAIGAAGKNNLLGRIEKIVGMEKKPVFRFAHFAGFVTTLLCVFAVNTVLITSGKNENRHFAFNNLANPFYFLAQEEVILHDTEVKKTSNSKATEPGHAINKRAGSLTKAETKENPEPFPPIPAQPPVAEPHPAFINVAYKEVGNKLSEEEKKKVTMVVQNTRQFLTSVQWKEIEKTIGDVLTETEKEEAKKEYLQEVRNIDWENLEKNLKAGYEQINWEKINTELKTALAAIQIDSIQHSYETLLRQIEMAEKVQLQSECSSEISTLFPDTSLDEVKKAKNKIRKALNEIRTLQNKEIIKL